jgi:hypothetical protein
MIIVGCLVLEFHKEMVKKDFNLGLIREDSRVTCCDKRGDGKEPLLESRELEENSSGGKSVRRNFEEVNK